MLGAARLRAAGPSQIAGFAGSGRGAHRGPGGLRQARARAEAAEELEHVVGQGDDVEFGGRGGELTQATHALPALSQT